jgi:hypothetical protein
MTASTREARPLSLLSAMVCIGLGVLAIPWFLTPPAYLDLALRDAAFGSDLSQQSVTVTDQRTGRILHAGIQKIGGQYVARIGRINSGTGTFSTEVAGYRPGAAHVVASALQRLRATVDLAPTFGRLEITTWNAMRDDEPVTATVKEEGRPVSYEAQRAVLVTVPPGVHRFSAKASGFCEAAREFDVREGKTTKAAIPLSPALTGDEVARFVLGWRNEPRDLDTHFWKSDAVTFPSPTTVYFRNKNGTLPNGETFARLDVDQLYPGRYETLTVRAAATGTFRYFVHAYQGFGTIDDAVATVQLYTRGCEVRTFTPPRNCGFRIWNVTSLHYSGNRVELADIQQCVPEGTVAIRKSG